MNVPRFNDGDQIVEHLRATRSPAALCNPAFEAEVRSVGPLRRGRPGIPEPAAPMPIAHEDENGVIWTYLAGELVGRREPGWYTPVSDVVVTFGEVKISAGEGFRVPVTIGHHGDGQHTFIATGIRAEDGGTTFSFGDRYLIKCPDRPVVGWWRKV